MHVMIDPILRDEVPKAISYPIHESFFEESFGDATLAAPIGLYLIYTSGSQVTHYDPLVSAATRYPVLALDVRVPPLNANVVSGLFEAKIRKKRLPMAGYDRAEKQLRGETGAEWWERIDRMTGAEKVEAQIRYLELPELSIAVFPVKRRLRARVADAIELQGLRPMANWVSASFAPHGSQRPLVLVYDEESGAIQTKFADSEGLQQRNRVYR
jgi:hypothetical protein